MRSLFCELPCPCTMPRAFFFSAMRNFALASFALAFNSASFRACFSFSIWSKPRCSGVCCTAVSDATLLSVWESKAAPIRSATLFSVRSTALSGFCCFSPLALELSTASFSSSEMSISSSSSPIERPYWIVEVWSAVPLPGTDVGWSAEFFSSATPGGLDAKGGKLLGLDTRSITSTRSDTRSNSFPPSDFCFFDDGPSSTSIFAPSFSSKSRNSTE
mmetsp:Transcript_31738/g.58143  ORF Transcript_31738/g.58143 Transcript_31738/m.58143 type:complete len:217 (+) Transcript_31738:1644-2294(+)